MTLQIKDVEIAGVPAIKVRNALRDVTQVNKDYLADRCKLSTRRAQQVIDALVKDGFLCPPHKEKELAGSYRPPEKPRYRYVDYYKLTNKGEKLALASAVNKMPRAKAETILAAFLKRVEEVNATAEYLYNVPCVVVYGSFVCGAALLSDVDVAVELTRKSHFALAANDPSAKEWTALIDARVAAARAKGRSFGSYFNELDWPEHEVMLHLKARTRGLSIHPLTDFVGMKKDENFAYKVLVGDASIIAKLLANPSSADRYSELVFGRR